MVVNSKSKHLVCDPAQPPAAEELLRWWFVHQPVPPLGRLIRHPEPYRPSNVLWAPGKVVRHPKPGVGSSLSQFDRSQLKPCLLFV